MHWPGVISPRHLSIFGWDNRKDRCANSNPATVATRPNAFGDSSTWSVVGSCLEILVLRCRGKFVILAITCGPSSVFTEKSKHPTLFLWAPFGFPRSNPETKALNESWRLHLIHPARLLDVSSLYGEFRFLKTIPSPPD